MSMKVPPSGAQKRNVVVPANNREVPCRMFGILSEGKIFEVEPGEIDILTSVVFSIEGTIRKGKKLSFRHFLLAYCQTYQEQHHANEMTIKVPPGGAEKRNVVIPANNREVPCRMFGILSEEKIFDVEPSEIDIFTSVVFSIPGAIRKRKKGKFTHFPLTYCQTYQEQHHAIEMLMKVPPGGQRREMLE
jgi:hypothetical protein